MSQCVRPQDHIRPVTWVHAGVSLGDGEVRRGQYLWGKTVPGGTLIGKQKLWETLLQTHAMLPVKSWLWETENVLIMLVMLMKTAKNASFSVSWKVMFKVKWMVNFISFQDILLHLLVLNCWTSPHFKMHLQHWSSYCALITNLKVKLY